MPELPEVETVRRQLEQSVVGEKIESNFFPDRKSKVLRGDLEKVVNQKIIGVRRFGKLLILDLSDQFSLAVHLKMTGRLTLLNLKEDLPSHTHLIFSLQNKKRLVFSDIRKFGYVQIISTREVKQLSFVKTLGKEPLKDLSLKDFHTLLQGSARPIKFLLLDQQKIAGIGNIYACEALWMAGIHPHRGARTLLGKEEKRLFQAVETVLREGIERGGASDNTYRNLFGAKGKYQDFFKVYGRAGKSCKICGTPIERFAQGGRGTWICSHCQK